MECCQFTALDVKLDEAGNEAHSVGVLIEAELTIMIANRRLDGSDEGAEVGIKHQRVGHDAQAGWIALKRSDARSSVLCDHERVISVSRTDVEGGRTGFQQAPQVTIELDFV